MNLQSHYFLSPILVYDGKLLKTSMSRALVSRNGIYKVFEESEEMQRAFLSAKVFKVRLDGFDYQARLVRESGPDGSHYNLRLTRAEPQVGKHLQELIGRYGFESPWKRDFARISAGSVILQVEAPVAAILNRFTGTIMTSVRNFSYHGLFVELLCACPSMSETVGQTIRFKIITSKGTTLDGASGRIARIYDEMVAPGKLKRGLGIRIQEMLDSSRKAYHLMILESCKELQKSKGKN